MISKLLWWLPDWFAARFLDGLAAGEDIPDVLAAWGVVALVVAAVVFTWMVAGWWLRRRAEHGQPDPEDLLDSESWLADRTEEVLVPPRRPRPRHRYPVACHPPQSAVEATQVIARVVDDPDATLVIPATYGGRHG